MQWYTRTSHAKPHITERVWHDVDNDREYMRDPDPTKGTWHEINWRLREYREIDPDTGQPVAGGEGRWRKLK